MGTSSNPIPFLARHANGVAVTCWAVPGASRSEITGQHGSNLKVRLAAPPEGGRANAELCRLLASAFGVEADLLSGGAARRKVVLLVGAEMAAVRSIVVTEGYAET